MLLGSRQWPFFVALRAYYHSLHQYLYNNYTFISSYIVSRWVTFKLANNKRTQISIKLLWLYSIDVQQDFEPKLIGKYNLLDVVPKTVVTTVAVSINGVRILMQWMALLLVGTLVMGKRILLLLIWMVDGHVMERLVIWCQRNWQQ